MVDRTWMGFLFDIDCLHSNLFRVQTAQNEWLIEKGLENNLYKKK